ncbi:MAG: terminase small subunit [Chlamydiia bacterium]
MPAPKNHKPYPGCERGGRPIKYTVEFIEAEADAFEAWMQREDSLWYKDFALERGYLPDQLSEWAKINEKFSRTYRKSQEWQQSKLIKGGLLNQFNAGFTKFVMGNTCGWSDKQQIGGDAVNPLSFLLQRVDGSSKDLVDG